MSSTSARRPRMMSAPRVETPSQPSHPPEKIEELTQEVLPLSQENVTQEQVQEIREKVKQLILELLPPPQEHMTTEKVQKLVQDSLPPPPEMSPEQVQKLVQELHSSLPEIMSPEKVQKLVQDSLPPTPETMTTGKVSEIVQALLPPPQDISPEKIRELILKELETKVEELRNVMKPVFDDVNNIQVGYRQGQKQLQQYQRQMEQIKASQLLTKPMKVMLLEGVQSPQYQTPGSSGMDLRANEKLTLEPGSTKLVKTGVHIELPVGYEAQIRGRSGMNLKGIWAAVGTIDTDYRGELGVVLHNMTNSPYEVAVGDRIAQLVVMQYQRVDIEVATALSDTSRGSGGFGSTGKN